MIIYFTVDENNYVDGWGSTRSNADEIELELDDKHEFFTTDSRCWKYENGELMFDEERKQQLVDEYEQEQNKPSEKERLEALENALLELVLND